MHEGQGTLGLSTSTSIENKEKNLPYIHTKLAPAKPTKVFDSYWRFATKRQDIFFRKTAQKFPPWTNDSILIKYKFTNAYRASDRVSQFLIQNVIYNDTYELEDLFFRIILFKIFNKIETWEYIEKEMGGISYQTYSFERYNQILTRLQDSGASIYSGAYIMASAKSAFGYSKKHRNHLSLIEKMMEDELPIKISDAKSMQDVYLLLREYPSIGNFLAYQYAIDINYSPITDFSEMDFVVPGPGAFDGIHKCFSDLGGLNEVEIIKYMADNQQEEFERLGLKFQDLWGRPLQLIDCQNLFCEIDKYSRVAHPDIKGKSDRKRIKQQYTPVSKSLKLWYPPKWGINNKIEKYYERLE